MTRVLAFGKRALERLVATTGAMSRPSKILAISTTVAAIALVSWFGWHSTDTQWAVLFSNLDRDDAAAVVAKLKEAKTPYRLEGDGSIIEVPQTAARELRLELAGAGLPRGGGVGFESFDKMRLGATEFEQRVLFRRALEGELARTIDTLSAVQSARVHLVLPERSVFVGRAEPASASVVLKLRSGRVLGGSEVSGIVHLVSASVPGLAPDHVAVVDTAGGVLHKPRTAGESGTGLDEEGAQEARMLESTLEERARAMLEKVAGSGHVDVRVTAELDRARIERVEDRYDPKNTVVRSEESSIEHSGGELPLAGVPGAQTNLPGSTRSVDGGAPEGVTREQHTRNYEVDHVTEKRLVTGGRIRRLTVAVVIDGGRANGHSKEDVERIAALVRSAVGADERRGDSVTVESVPFLDAEPAAPAPPPTPILAQLEKGRRYAPYAGAALGAVMLLGVIALASRGKKRRAEKAAAAAAAAAETKALNAIIQAQPEIDAEPSEELMTAPDLKSLDIEELRAAVLDRAHQDPATAALVLRFLLGNGVERREQQPQQQPALENAPRA